MPVESSRLARAAWLFGFMRAAAAPISSMTKPTTKKMPNETMKSDTPSAWVGAVTVWGWPSRTMP
ncbi:hypothetical protein D3C78_1402310 [compost metagenome]